MSTMVVVLRKFTDVCAEHTETGSSFPPIVDRLYVSVKLLFYLLLLGLHLLFFWGGFILILLQRIRQVFY